MQMATRSIHVLHDQTHEIRSCMVRWNFDRKIKYRQTSVLVSDQRVDEPRLTRNRDRAWPGHHPADLLGSGGQPLPRNGKQPQTGVRFSAVLPAVWPCLRN